MANPYQYWNKQMEMGPNRPPYERTTPTKQWNPFSGASSADVPPPSSSRKSSILSAGQPEASPSSSRKSSILSYSQPFGAAVDFKHSAPPCPDEIIFVAVRLSSPFRSKSLEPCDELPSRPPRRSFLKRLTTRWQGSESEDTYKAIRMPRADYKRYFMRDKHGNYTGTEPERQWSEADVMREFSAYQDMSLRSLSC